MLKCISQIKFCRDSTHSIVDDQSYCIPEGGIEAFEGFWVNVVIDRVL